MSNYSVKNREIQKANSRQKQNESHTKAKSLHLKYINLQIHYKSCIKKKHTSATMFHIFTSADSVQWKNVVVPRVTKDDFLSHILIVFHTSPSDPDTGSTLGVRILFEPGNTDSWSQASDTVQLSILALLLEDKSCINECDKLCAALLMCLRLYTPLILSRRANSGDECQYLFCLLANSHETFILFKSTQCDILRYMKKFNKLLQYNVWDSV